MNQSNNPYPSSIVMKFIRGFGFAVSKLIWRIEFHGIENIPQKLPGGLIVAANHQTYFDAFWVIIPLTRKLRFMVWDKAFKVFGIGSLIRYLGAFPVDIEHGDKRAYQKSVEVLREGATLVIFPEGSRAFSDGKVLDFKTGAIRMAIDANVPILPVTIRGANKVWAREMKYPRPFQKIEVVYYPPMQVSSPAEDSDSREHARRLTLELKNIIEQGLSEH